MRMDHNNHGLLFFRAKLLLTQITFQIILLIFILINYFTRVLLIFKAILTHN